MLTHCLAAWLCSVAHDLDIWADHARLSATGVCAGDTENPAIAEKMFLELKLR